MAKYIDVESLVIGYSGHTPDDEFSKGVDFVLDLLDSKPPADVRPVVRGRWKQTGGKYSRHKTIDRRILTCSVCGNILYMEGVNAGRGDANFCPNCGSYNGADMRGGENDG